MIGDLDGLVNRQQPPGVNRGAAAAAGIAAGVALAGVWAVPYGLSIAPYPPFDLADLFIRYSPGGIATWGIETFGRNAQRVLLATGVIIWPVVWAAIGIASRNRLDRRAGTLVGLALVIPVLLLSAWAATDPSLARLVWLALLFGATLALTGRLLARWLTRLRAIERERTTPPGRYDWLDSPGDAGRRELLQQMAGVAVIAGLGGGLLGRLLHRSEVAQTTTSASTPLHLLRTSYGQGTPTGTPIALPTSVPAPPLADTFDAPPGLEPRLTSNDRFYVIDISTRDPRLDERAWSLRVRGQVERELTISYADLLAMPSVELDGTLMCISFEYGTNLISNTRWTGVPLHDVLALAGVRDGVYDVILRGSNGYSDSIPLDKALEPTTLLAYAMNGETLPTAHGFPCRVYVPGLYGEKNVKWLQEIELTADDYIGYWQERGWTDVAIIQTTSTIETPRGNATRDAGGVVPVGGIAFAGTRGIQSVDVRIDDGEWQPATVEPYVPDFVWQRWRFDWRPDPGDYRLTVRATDGAGSVQVAEERPPHPDGMTGLQTIRITVNEPEQG